MDIAPPISSASRPRSTHESPVLSNDTPSILLSTPLLIVAPIFAIESKTVFTVSGTSVKSQKYDGTNICFLKSVFTWAGVGVAPTTSFNHTIRKAEYFVDEV